MQIVILRSQSWVEMPLLIKIIHSNTMNMDSKMNMASFFPDYQRSTKASTWICFSNVVSSAPLDLTHTVATLVHTILILLFSSFLCGPYAFQIWISKSFFFVKMIPIFFKFHHYEFLDSSKSEFQQTFCCHFPSSMHFHYFIWFSTIFLFLLIFNKHEQISWF